MTIDEHRARSIRNPERDLWAAVIYQVLVDACGAPSSSRARVARAWFMKPNRDFNVACHLAGLDPEAVRERATRLIEEHDNPPPKPDNRGSKRKAHLDPGVGQSHV